jgi:hypothetical protein
MDPTEALTIPGSTNFRTDIGSRFAAVSSCMCRVSCMCRRSVPWRTILPTILGRSRGYYHASNWMSSGSGCAYQPRRVTFVPAVLRRFTNSDCVVRFGGAEAVQVHRKIGQSRLSNGHRDGRFRLLAATEFVRCRRPDAATIKVMPAKIAAESDY